MSEKKAVEAVKPTKNGGKQKKSPLDHLNELAARNKEKWASLNAMQKVGIVLICILAQFFCFKVSATYAVLYMFAHNGKFSGRMDGNVMMINGRSRGYANPALVRNSYTMTARGVFSVLSSSFRGLSTAQILEWNAAQLDATDRRGLSIAVKGKDLYVRLNANLIVIGQPTIADPPVFGAVPAIQDITGFTATAATGVVTFGFTPDPTDANVIHEVYATAPLSPGVSRPGKSAFRLITTIPGAQASPFAFTGAYAAKYGSILTQAGAKIFIQLYGVNSTTGQKIPSVGTSAVIV